MPRRYKPKTMDGSTPLREVSGRLPRIFDTMWDAKYAEDLDWHGLRNDPVVQRMLAQNGYDVKTWLRNPPSKRPWDNWEEHDALY